MSFQVRYNSHISCRLPPRDGNFSYAAEINGLRICKYNGIWSWKLRTLLSLFSKSTYNSISSFHTNAGSFSVFQGKLNPMLPYVAMAFLSLLGIIASIFLPETLHRSLPESIEEANHIGKDVKFWTYLPHKTSKQVENGDIPMKKK